jgi:predicted XRE-type DNA-binding protein
VATREQLLNGEGTWFDVDPTTGCWLWSRYRYLTGYGTVWFDGKNQRAHRVLWELHNGPIPEGMCICHKCDTPGCVNPDHLFLGTHADNVHDRNAKGRAVVPCGNGHWRSRLSEADIPVIHQRLVRGETQASIAEDFGVVKSVISNIVRGEAWKHVEISAHNRAPKGRRVSMSGSRSGSAKLTETDVLEIRGRVWEGESQRSVAERFGVTQASVYYIAHGKTWKHTQGPFITKEIK